MDKIDMTKSVAGLLKSSRLNKGMTESDVAKALDVSLRTYQRIEKGQMTLDNLCAACSFFGLDLFNLNATKIPEPTSLIEKPKAAGKTTAQIMQEIRERELEKIRNKRK